MKIPAKSCFELSSSATLAVLLAVSAAHAAPIQYIFEGNGSGMVDAAPFTDKDWRIDAIADTDNIVTVDANVSTIYANEPTMTIDTFGAGDVGGPVGLYSNTTLPGVGFGYDGGSDLLGVGGAPFAGYALATPLGPVPNLTANSLSQFVDLATTLGLVDLNSSGPVTFEAVMLTECGTAPVSGCHAATKGQINVKGNESAFEKNTFKWKWQGASDLSEFGNPVDTNANYRLCIYEDFGNAMNPAIHVNETCPNDEPCWSATDTSYRFKHKTGSLDGITQLRYQSKAGAATISVVGKGLNLQLGFPFIVENGIVVQLVANSGECWETDFPAPARQNDNVKFRLSDTLP